MVRQTKTTSNTKTRKNFTSNDVSDDVREFVVKQLIRRRGVKALKTVDSHTIDRIERGEAVPLQAFLSVLDWANQVDAIDIDDMANHYTQMQIVDQLSKYIILQWKNEAPYNGVELPSDEVLSTLAESAARAAVNQFALGKNKTNLATLVSLDGKVVDPQTDLVLPPPARNPYQERHANADGQRLDAFEHLKKEYGDYIGAGLLFSGHILEIDRPAYEAALYLARKQVRLNNAKEESTTTAEVFLANGIIAGEHLEHPPQHLKAQIELINRSRALAMAPKARGRRSAIPPSNERK